MSVLSPILGVYHAVAWLNREASDSNRHAVAILAELDRLLGLIRAQHECVVCGSLLLPDLADQPPFCAESKCESDINTSDCEDEDGTPCDSKWHRTDTQWRAIARQIEDICESDTTYAIPVPPRSSGR